MKNASAEGREYRQLICSKDALMSARLYSEGSLRRKLCQKLQPPLRECTIQEQQIDKIDM